MRNEVLSQILNEKVLYSTSTTNTELLPKSIMEATLVVDCHCELGEGVLYDDIQNCILWTDIDGKQFHSLDLTDGSHRTKDLPKMLCSFAMLQQPPHPEEHGNDNGSNCGVYLCAWEDGFQLYDIENSQAWSEMSMGENPNPMNLPSRLNDGRVDPSGKRFICGGYNGDIDGCTMKVFKCEIITAETTTHGSGGTKKQQQQQQQQLRHDVLVDSITVTNSICFSPNGKTFYLADSPTKEIVRYNYDMVNGTFSTFFKEDDATSSSSSSRVVCKHDVGVPDGSCVDSQGNIWNAVWRGGDGPSMVKCINPVNGEVLCTVRMPDSTSQVTCCCFGGKDLDILFITTAKIGLENQGKEEPNAGGLYAVKVGVKGCLEKRFEV